MAEDEAIGTKELRRVLLFLLLPALLLRVLNLYLCSGDALVRYPFGDGLAYAKWALSIAEGDWLGLGRPVFYQAPLYPYFLAVLQSVGLGLYPWPQIFHLLFGVAAVFFVYLGTRRLGGHRSAFVAGGILALFGPMLMYELFLEKTSLGLLLSSLTFYLIVRAGSGAVGKRVLVLGLVIGVSAMLRENLLLLAPCLAVLYLLRQRSVRPALLMAAGAMLGVLPSLSHNLFVGAAFLPTSYQAGTNFYMGNHAGAEGTYEPLVASRGDVHFEETDARRLAAEDLGMPETAIAAPAVSSYWMRKGLSFAAEHPIDWMLLQLRKLQWFVYHAEAPDTVPYAAFRAGRPWLMPGRLMFGLLSPLALLGLLFAWREAKWRAAVVSSLVLSSSVVLFYVVSRYRLACLPFLAPFAAHGAVQLVTHLREASREKAWPRLAALAGLLLASQLWLLPRGPRGLERDQQLALLDLNRGTTLGTWKKDKADARRLLERSLEREPELLAARRALARVLMAPSEKDYQAALEQLLLLTKARPESPEAQHNLAYCRLRLGRVKEALRGLERYMEAREAPLPKRTQALLRELKKSAAAPGR